MRRILFTCLIFLLISSIFTNSTFAKNKSMQKPICGEVVHVSNWDYESFIIQACIDQINGVIYSSFKWSGATNGGKVSVFIRDDSIGKTVRESDNLSLSEYGTGNVPGPIYTSIPCHSYHVYIRSYDTYGDYEGSNSPKVIGEKTPLSCGRSYILPVKIHGTGNYK